MHNYRENYKLMKNFLSWKFWGGSGRAPSCYLNRLPLSSVGSTTFPKQSVAEHSGLCSNFLFRVVAVGSPSRTAFPRSLRGRLFASPSSWLPASLRSLGPIGRLGSLVPGTLIGAFDWRVWVQIFNGTEWVPRRVLLAVDCQRWGEVSRGEKRGAAGAPGSLLPDFQVAGGLLLLEGSASGTLCCWGADLTRRAGAGLPATLPFMTGFPRPDRD